MVNSMQVRFRLRKNIYEYLEDYRDIHNLSNNSAAINRIIEEHRELSNKQWDLNYISRTVAITVQEEMKRDLKKLLIAINHTDFNTQILIELLQGFMIVSNKNAIPTTKDYKPDFLETVEKVVRERIAKSKVKKS